MRKRLLPFAALVALSCSPARIHVEAPTQTVVATSSQALVATTNSGHRAGSSAGSAASMEVRSDASAGSVEAHDEHLGNAHAGESLWADATPIVFSKEQIEERVASDLGSLGSMSLGKANAGALVNGVQFPEGDRWDIIQPQRAWGTQETIDFLVTAIDKVHTEHPGAHPLSIGHLSRDKGGRIYPHRSHQSGRDIDIGYYYVPEKAEWYRPANKHTLDKARSWALVKAFVIHTDVEMVFIDRSVQKLLKEYALSVGEDPSWLNSIFQYKSRHPEPIVRHTYGHRTHIHVRFYNPRAQQLGVDAYDALVRAKIIRPRHYLVPYQPRKSDTLASLAKRAGTSAATIQKLNGIGGLKSGKVLYVPMRGHVSHVRQVVVPPRRLPPVATGGRAIVAAASE